MKNRILLAACLLSIPGLTSCATGETELSTGGGGSGASGGATSAGGAGGSGGAGAAGGGGTTSAGGDGGDGGGGAAGGAGPCGAPQCTGDVTWVKRYGPTQGQQFSYGMGVDGMGQATIAGGFNPAADFGEKQVATAGGLDMFWAKVSPDGVTLAAKAFGGAGNDLATGAAVDRKGNSAYYGVFSGTLDFGNGPLVAQNFRMFLARLEPDGTAAWSKAFGDMVNASSQTASFDLDGNILYAAGYFGDIDFGAGPVTGGSHSLTITKYSVAGAALWSKKLATYMSSPLAVLGDGSIVLSAAGTVDEPADIGCGLPLTGRTLAHLSADGACLWQKPMNGPAIDGIVAEGDVFALHARINGDATIGDDTFSLPGGKRLVAMYGSDGTLRGSLVVADDTIYIDALAVDTGGGAVFKARMDSGSTAIDGHLLTGDSCLVRLGPAGEWLWGHAFTGDAAGPASAAIGPLGHVFLYGRADGPLDFGTGLLPGGATPDEDLVLAKFEP
jgi:hypothetical protein